jgi:acyl-CoA dehydrogenase
MYGQSDAARELLERLEGFIEAEIKPAEPRYFEELDAAADRYAQVPVIGELKRKARDAGLWNLFHTAPGEGAGLTNVEYAPMCEAMGSYYWSPVVFNCAAPDTGNMELLSAYGTEAQKDRWLRPLLDGEIRSCFAMTEPAVASSDATNIELDMRAVGDDYVLNGRKWWSSGILNADCELLIVMGKTDRSAEPYRQQSTILVPRDTPGLTVVRKLPVFGYDEAPWGHAEVDFTDVTVPAINVLGGPGRGFEMAQARLGPGRIHHCMRAIGLAERALEQMCRRAMEREPFGMPLADRGVTRERIAESRMAIDQARLLVLEAAHKLDTVGNKAARREIAMIKVVAPRMASEVIDRAIQLFGAAGLTTDSGLAYAYSRARLMRLADGPDEVHREQVGQLELRKYGWSASARGR